MQAALRTTSFAILISLMALSAHSVDPETAQEIPAGGYMFHPAGAAHWDGARGTTDAVVQIIGNGPVLTEQSGNEPMWLHVHE